MRRVRQLFPLLAFRIVLIHPRDVSVPVSVLDTTHDVYFVFIDEDPCGPAPPVSRNFGPHAPFIFLRVEDVDVWDWGFMWITSRKCAQYPHFVLKGDGLEVVHFDGCLNVLHPFFSLEIKRLRRFNAATAEENEFVFYCS